MPNKKESWMDRHSANVVRYAVPVIFGDRPHPSDPVHQNLGTGVIVEAGEGAFLITAAHVIEHAQGRATEPRFHFMVGPVELGLGRVIAVNARLDIATLHINASELARLENDGLQIVRPFEWPLSGPTIGAPVVLAGFPGDWRTSLSWHELEVGSTTMRAFVRSSSEEQFTTRLDQEHQVHRLIDVSADNSEPFAFPGLSGGPAFLEPVSSDMLSVARLCGIVKQGGKSDLVDGQLVVICAQLDRLRRNGSLG